MTGRTRVAPLMVAATLLSGCVWTHGSTADDAFNDGRGRTAAFSTVEGNEVGELLMADESGFVAASGGWVLRASWTDVRSFYVAGLVMPEIEAGSAPDAALLERIRSAARFPFGLGDASLEELVAQSGWAGIRDVGR